MASGLVGEIIGPDILIILAIVLLLFGSTKLPKLARSLGESKLEFHRGLNEASATPAVSEPTPQPSTPAPPPAITAGDPDERITLTRADEATRRSEATLVAVALRTPGVISGRNGASGRAPNAAGSRVPRGRR
jgi:sec-independent protein translocase protein TatA